MFRAVLLIVFAAAILSALLVQPAVPAYAGEPESECWAVIVGVSDYQQIGDLSYADDDAEELAQLLGPVWGEDHIRLLVDAEATKAEVRQAMNWLVAQDSPGDTVLFCFSGHGDPDGYIAPYDAYYAETWISRSELASWLDKLDSQKVVVILDTCHAGRFETSLDEEGRVILMSSAANEVSWETPTLRHSVFVHYILEALDEFADVNHDYELSAEELFQYAEPETVDYTEFSGFTSTQHPVLYDGYPGELILLVEFVFETEPSIPSGTPILVVDNQPYLSYSSPLIYAPGSALELEVVSPVGMGEGIRYVFASWGDGNTSLSRTASNGGVYEIRFNKEYRLAINSEYGEPQGAGWYLSGSVAAISVASVEGATTRHIFIGWSGDYTGSETTASLAMNSPRNVTANWQTEYLLTIESEYGEPQGAGWYTEGRTAAFSVPSSTGVIIRHVFTGWSGDYTGTETAALLTMNSPKAIVANWRTDYIQLYILVGGVVVLVVVIIVVLRLRRRG